MKGKAKKDLKAGMLVKSRITEKGVYVFEPFYTLGGNLPDGRHIPLGIAARDIKKGELIEWNPVGNTKDILRQGSLEI